MSKGRFFTLIMLFLSISIVFGGWFFIRELLEHREEKLLAKSGKISMQSSEFILQQEQTEEKNKKQGQEEEKDGFQGTTLSNESIEFVLNAWEEGGYIILHEPQKGQMSMEQAITAGLTWISSLSEQKLLPSFFQEGYNFKDTSASLSTLDVETDFEKSLLSFWDVCYIGDDLSIVLRIHAESGQVWSANISIRNDKISYNSIVEEVENLYKDHTFIKLVFPFLEEPKNNTKILVSYNNMLEQIGESNIFAGIKWNMFEVDEGKPMVDIIFWLCTENSNQYWSYIDNMESEQSSDHYSKNIVIDKSGEEGVGIKDVEQVEEKK